MIKEYVEQGKNLLKSDFFKKVFETFSTRIFLLFLGLVTSAIITRILEPKGRGLVAAATTITAIGVQFGNLGLHSSNTYYVAKDMNLLGRLVGNSLFFGFFVNGLWTTFLYIVFLRFPQIAPLQGSLLFLGLILIPITLSYMLLQNLLLGIDKSSEYNKIERITGLLNILLISILILVKQVSPSRVYIVSLVTASFGIILALSGLKIKKLSKLKLSVLLFKDNFAYGFKSYLVCFLGFMVLRSDILLIQYILGYESVGYYSVAVGLIDKLYMIPTAISTILFPKLASHNNIEEKWRATKKVIYSTISVMLPLIIISYILSKSIITVLYGNDFTGAILAFNWLLPGVFFLSITSILSSYIGSIDIPKELIYIYGLGVLLNTSINIFLLGKIGIVAASISSSLTYAVILSLMCLFAISLSKGKTIYEYVFDSSQKVP
ncbi:MAG: oligosaccharide flippase family protein [Cyanobacteriota bacterium]|jgi:O-antigen/teichoic acid export membrane protein